MKIADLMKKVGGRFYATEPIIAYRRRDGRLRLVFAEKVAGDQPAYLYVVDFGARTLPAISEMPDCHLTPRRLEGEEKAHYDALNEFDEATRRLWKEEVVGINPARMPLRAGWI